MVFRSASEQLKSNKVLVLIFNEIKPLKSKALLFLCYNQSKKPTFLKQRNDDARDFFMFYFQCAQWGLQGRLRLLHAKLTPPRSD
ncbi:hypothetical protein FIM82_07800 [Helicobacter pylori]|nr:hypothetical protein FIM82_07800 [Helicobacter pylori]